MGYEPTYSGITSLFRRKYSRAISDADIIAWGITYDLTVTNRPGSRFGPRAIRAASTNLAWDGGPWPWEFDPFENLKMIDYGDCSFDPGFPEKVPPKKTLGLIFFNLFSIFLFIATTPIGKPPPIIFPKVDISGIKFSFC